MKSKTIRVNERPFLFLDDNCDKRFIYFYGGAGSSKSWTLAQHLVIRKFYGERDVGILALRKTKPEVKASCLEVVRRQLLTGSLPFYENKTESILRAPNGNRFMFEGVDDVVKKKSMEGINYIWVEETTEFTHREWLQLKLRHRAANINPGRINQMFHSFNPEDPVGNAWLKSLVDDAEADSESAVLKLNHGDNPFLSAEARANIEALVDEDEEYDKIYRLGEWATPRFIIYNNWDIVPQFPADDDLDFVGYGLDFGYVNPTALVKIGVKDRVHVFLEEIIYQSGMHNAALIEAMKLAVPNRHSVILADSSEPAYIDEIAGAGFNIWAAAKVKGQKGGSFVKTGIDRVKRRRLHITRNSPNIRAEIQGYKWRQDKDGQCLPEPVKFRDHTMDAIRYFLGGVFAEETDIDVVGEYDLD